MLHPVGTSRLYQFGLSPNKWIDYMYSGKPIIVPYNGYQSIINEAKCDIFIESDNPNLLASEIMKFYNMSKKMINDIGRNGKICLQNNLSYFKLAKELSENF